YFLSKDVSKAARFLLFGTAVVVSFGLAFHFLPGFHNWKICANAVLSPGAHPYNLWLNFDKPFIVILSLAFTIPLIPSRTKLLKVLKIGVPMSITGILILIGISLYFNIVQWDPKIPTFIFVWLLHNLIFVSIPEEAFFRGFIQRELYRWFGKT